jgi:uncharacterized membrane protein
VEKKMNTNLVVIMKFLHNLFTAVWIGGLFMMAMTLFPALKKTFGHSAESEKVMDAVMRRQGKWVIMSIIGLALTGVLLARSSGRMAGLMRFDSQYASVLSIKHILVLLMTAIALTRLFGFRNLEKQPDLAKKKTSLILMHVNTVIGVVILLLSAWTAVL